MYLGSVTMMVGCYWGRRCQDDVDQKSNMPRRFKWTNADMKREILIPIWWESCPLKMYLESVTMMVGCYGGRPCQGDVVQKSVIISSSKPVNSWSSWSVFENGFLNGYLKLRISSLINHFKTNVFTITAFNSNCVIQGWKWSPAKNAEIKRRLLHLRQISSKTWIFPL